MSTFTHARLLDLLKAIVTPHNQRAGYLFLNRGNSQTWRLSFELPFSNFCLQGFLLGLDRKYFLPAAARQRGEEPANGGRNPADIKVHQTHQNAQYLRGDSHENHEWFFQRGSLELTHARTTLACIDFIGPGIPILCYERSL